MTKNQKKMIVVLSPEKASPWYSCISITQNLLKTYQMLFLKESQALTYENFTPASLKLMASCLIKAKPSHLVFIDHQQGYLPLIKYLASNHPGFLANLRIVIHVFGDFTLSASTWCYFEQHLKGLNIKFLGASERQCELLKTLIHDKGSVAYQPFTVDTSIWNYKKNKINDYYVYSGRISATKNVELLCEYFARYQRLCKTKSKLVICGEFDDLGAPYFGFHPPKGFSQTSFTYKILLNKDISPYIEFRGFQNTQELKKLLTGAKGIISLSTYHDEDFGMAIAEALCLGTPSLLTQWAGFSSFNIDEKLVQYVPVKFEEGKITLSYSDFESAMSHLEIHGAKKVDREQLAIKAQEKFGILQKELKQHLDDEFTPFFGFTLNYYYIEKNHCRFSLRNGLRDYQIIYRSYYGQV